MKVTHNLPPSPFTKVQKDTPPDLQQAIKLRALELYEQRGREAGHELDDWLQAEAELTQRRTKTIAA